jgi:nucleotide-binding universal stress UspA family protein
MSTRTLAAAPAPPQPATHGAAPLGELHYHRLLVAIDGSAHSDLALAAAVTVARRDHAAITIICVAPDLAAEVARWPWAAPCSPGLQSEIDESALATLRTAVDRIPEDIPVTKVFRRGKAGPEIVRHVAESTYDAVLVGARGAGGVRGLVGSVSRYVLQHAGTTVFTAHAPPETEGAL